MSDTGDAVPTSQAEQVEADGSLAGATRLDQWCSSFIWFENGLSGTHQLNFASRDESNSTSRGLGYSGHFWTNGWT